MTPILSKPYYRSVTRFVADQIHKTQKPKTGGAS
jgi:hypothetical protein